MGRLLTRSQLSRVTSWVETQHCTPWLSFMPLKRCSATPSPITSNIPSTEENGENLRQKLDNERFQTHRTILQFSRNVAILTCESSASSGVCDVYLVGTVHVSQKSCKEVQAIINFLKPEVVFLELCSGRARMLTQWKIPTTEEIITAYLEKKTNMLGLLLSLIYAKVASELKVNPGSEFRVAYEEAIKHGGRVVLGDRPFQITLARAWRNMSLWEMMKSLYSLAEIDSSPIEEVLDKLQKGIEICDIDMDMITPVLQEFAKRFPTLVEAIIHERDLYMSSKLLGVAKKSSCIVAVVGKGHLEGMQKHWKKPVEVNDLLTIPPPKPAKSAISLTSVSVAVAGIAIMWGIYLSSKNLT